jgi:hypothetical protein
MGAQTEPVDIEGHTEQQRLYLLRWRTSGQRHVRQSLRLAAEKTDQDERPLAIARGRELGPHLCTDATEAPSSLATLGRNDAVRADDLPDEGMVQLTVELAIRQHQPNSGEVAHLLQQRPQGGVMGAVVGGRQLGNLGQDQPPRQINDDHPCEPMASGEPLAAAAMRRAR